MHVWKSTAKKGLRDVLADTTVSDLDLLGSTFWRNSANFQWLGIANCETVQDQTVCWIRMDCWTDTCRVKKRGLAHSDCCFLLSFAKMIYFEGIKLEKKLSLDLIPTLPVVPNFLLIQMGDRSWNERKISVGCNPNPACIVQPKSVSSANIAFVTSCILTVMPRV